jgi:hypothetical protein
MAGPQSGQSRRLHTRRETVDILNKHDRATDEGVRLKSPQSWKTRMLQNVTQNNLSQYQQMHKIINKYKTYFSINTP